MNDPEIGKGNRLTVFVVPTEKDVRTIMRDKTGFFDGFYTGRVEGSLAYVPKKTENENPDQNAIFFHEYTHHLMKQALERPYPEWYVEGYAEFFSTPEFARDGSVWLGRIVQGRAYGLIGGPHLPLETLLTGMQPGMTNEQRDVYYGRSWLLTHYLQLDNHRRGQLTAYLAAMSGGATSIDAAHQAFGDLDQLDKDLNAYEKQRLLKFQVPASAIHLQPITVTPLSAGGSQVIMTLAQIKNGVNPTEAANLCRSAALDRSEVSRRRAGRNHAGRGGTRCRPSAGGDGRRGQGDRTRREHTEAMVLKGRALAKLADETENSTRHSLFEQARRVLISANKLDTEDPEPLYEFYRTFLLEGVRPTANALAALHYASDLAPQDLGVRMNSAIAYLNEGKPKEARTTLTVVAYSPHVGETGEVAKRMIAAIDAGNAKGALAELSRGSKPGSSH